MPAEIESDRPEDELQFATAEPVDVNGAAALPAAQTCAVCHQPIMSSYFALRDKILCPSCCELVKAPPPGTPSSRFFKAGFFGLGAALLGSLIWFAVRHAAHLQSGIIAVVVGFLVGKAVRKGSGGRGGRGYQILALVLTYCCIAANYLPDVLEGFADDAAKHHSTVAGSNGGNAGAASSNSTTNGKPSLEKGLVALVVLVAILVFFTLAAPVYAGIHSPIGLFIYGIALWEAWKFNNKAVLPITGPYQIGTPGTAGVSAPRRQSAVGL